MLVNIAAQAMNVLVHREFMEHTRKLREKERRGIPAEDMRGLMSMHVNGDDILSDTYRLALNFNSLSDYEEALSELQEEHDDFDRQAKEAHDIMMNLDDAGADAMMDELMAAILSPVDSLSRHDVLQRLACVYAVLLADWDKLDGLGVSDVVSHIAQDVKFADHLGQAFDVMCEAATLDRWNAALSKDKCPASDDVLSALKDLQP